MCICVARVCVCQFQYLKLLLPKGNLAHEPLSPEAYTECKNLTRRERWEMTEQVEERVTHEEGAECSEM